MARISPLKDADDDAGPESLAALDEIRTTHGRVTNMKRTLARAPVALHALMTWYDLRDQVRAVPGRATDHALRPRHLRRDGLPGLLDVLPPDPDRFGRGPGGTCDWTNGSRPSSPTAGNWPSILTASPTSFSRGWRTGSSPSRSWC